MHVQRGLCDHGQAAARDEFGVEGVAAVVQPAQVELVDAAYQRDLQFVAVGDADLEQVGVLHALAGAAAHAGVAKGLAGIGDGPRAVLFLQVRGVPVVEAFARGVEQFDAQVALQVGHRLGFGHGQLGAVGAAAIQRHHGTQIGLPDVAQLGMGHGASARRHEAGVIDLVPGEEQQAVLQDGQPQQGEDGADDGELEHGAAALGQRACRTPQSGRKREDWAHAVTCDGLAGGCGSVLPGRLPVCPAGSGPGRA